MTDNRDAEDALNLHNGDFAALVAPYLERIRQLCRIAVRDGHADDVVQSVVLRLLEEVRRGKSYTVPYRVVVYKVTHWTIQEHFQGKPTDVPLPDAWEPEGVERGYADVESEQRLMQAFEDLPDRERECVDLRYLHGLEIDQIAARLGIERNNVDQALFRARKKLREMFDES